MSTEAPPAPAALDPNAPPPAPSPAPSSAPLASDFWGKDWIKPDGSFDHGVFDKAPDEFKSFKKEVERYKSVPEYLKGQKERESLLGKKGIVDPLPANATPEMVAERSALLRKVNGAPEDAKGYGLTKPENLPDAAWDQKFADTVAGIAHKHGLPPSALKEMATAVLSNTQEQMATQQKAETEWYAGQDKLIRDSLQKDGLDFAGGQDLAQRAGRKWGVAPDSPLMKNATVFMLLTRLAKADREDQLITGELNSHGISPTLTAEAANTAADDIMRNKENPLYDAFHRRDHPEHDKAVAKWTALLKVVSKDKPQRGGR